MAVTSDATACALAPRLYAFPLPPGCQYDPCISCLRCHFIRCRLLHSPRHHRDGLLQLPLSNSRHTHPPSHPTPPSRPEHTSLGFLSFRVYLCCPACTVQISKETTSGGAPLDPLLWTASVISGSPTFCLSRRRLSDDHYDGPGLCCSNYHNSSERYVHI